MPQQTASQSGRTERQFRTPFAAEPSKPKHATCRNTFLRTRPEHASASVLLKTPHLKHRATTFASQSVWRPGIRSKSRHLSTSHRASVGDSEHWETQSPLVRRRRLYARGLSEAAVCVVAILLTRLVWMRQRLLTFVAVDLDRFWNQVNHGSAVRHQVKRRCVTILVHRFVMIVKSDCGIFRVTFVVLSLTLNGRFAMLTGMNMMCTTSENRMQQHRRHCQNAGYVTEHRGLHCAAITHTGYTFGRVLRTYPHRHKPDYHLNMKLLKVLHPLHA